MSKRSYEDAFVELAQDPAAIYDFGYEVSNPTTQLVEKNYVWAYEVHRLTRDRMNVILERGLRAAVRKYNTNTNTNNLGRPLAFRKSRGVEYVFGQTHRFNAEVLYDQLFKTHECSITFPGKIPIVVTFRFIVRNTTPTGISPVNPLWV